MNEYDKSKGKQIKVKSYQFNNNKLKEKSLKQKKSIAKETKVNIIMIAIAVLAIAIILVFTLIPQKKVAVNTTVEDVEIVENEKFDKAVQTVEENRQSKETIQQKPEYIQKYVDINPYVIGYIKIENTVIDYPVLQTDNNEYYMNHDINYDESKNGSIFMDFRCDIDDFSKTRNMIIYGHRMKDGSMFKGLLDYQSEDFFLENRIIQFDTIHESLEWKVFSVFETTTDFYYIDTEFPYDEMWIDFIERCQALSMHKTNMQLYEDDIVLTLSTCSTEENRRFVVMAKLLK